MILMIDKPQWVTSFDVVKKIKRIFYKEKIWHGGTLDPMATWLLIVCIWRENTKKLRFILDMEKEYIAEIDLSKKSDTRDMDYWNYFEEFKLIKENDVSWIIDWGWHFIKSPEIDLLKQILDKLKPNTELPLPPFSAKKVKWKRLYDMARSWDVRLMNSIMDIYWYEILSYKFPMLKIKIRVWSWTYIRSIAYWLGNALWLGWLLMSLRRIRIWNFVL